MVYPPVSLESTNRPSLETPVHSIPAASVPSVILPQQQILYPTYSTLPSAVSHASLNLQSQCSLLDLRRHPVANVAPCSIRTQEFRGFKNTKWHTKFRTPRMKEHPGSQSMQHQMPYAPTPLILYDPLQNHMPVQQSSMAPIYLNQSNLNQTPYLTDPYTGFNQSIMTSPYYKPPEMQTFCLIPDRQNPHNQFPQPLQPLQPSYYNVKSRFHVSTSAIYPTSSVTNSAPTNSGEKFLPTLSSSTPSMINDFTIKSCQNVALPNSKQINFSEPSFFEGHQSPSIIEDDKSNVNQMIKSKSTSLDEKYLDESLSFNFTIEAEKMVSDLCTSYDEFTKEGQQQSMKGWKTFEKIKVKEEASGTSIGTQTYDPTIDDIQLSELIRKSMNEGCNDIGKIMKNFTTTTARQNWLLNLSESTKIALGKSSSTCFPIYSGDKVFAHDLMNSFLRIGNGWLILDHYLNKQHPGLGEKYSKELITSFRAWETLMYDLLGQLAKTFVNLETKSGEETDRLQNPVMSNSLIPSDVSLYINGGFFGNSPPPTVSKYQQPTTLAHQQIINSPITSITPNIIQSPVQNYEQKYQWSSMGRGNKLRTKWTITENNTRATTDFSKEFSVPNLLGTEVQQRAPYNLFLPKVVESLSTMDSPIQPVNGNPSFWNACLISTPLNSNLTCPDRLPTSSSVNLANRMTLLGQIKTKKTDDATDDSETINLSAWFASMRNRKTSNIEPTTLTSNQNWWSSSPSARFTKPRDLKMDANRQLQTLKNMRTIQSAPWTANYLMDDRNTNSKRPEEYDSSEDLPVYMKPGSYNVPKKKNPSHRSNNPNRDSSESRNLCPQTDQVPLPLANFLADSSTSSYFDGTAETTNTSTPSSSSCSQDSQRDVTWKAACASAEILLGTLNLKDSNDIDVKEPLQNTIDEKIDENDDDEENCYSSQWKYDNCEKQDIDAFGNEEALENDSEVCKFSNMISHDGHQKTNVKTDSWLIKTLNNASNECKQKNNTDKFELSMESIDDDTEEDKSGNEKRSSYSLETSHTIAVMSLVDVVEKATYSETVRRCNVPVNTKLTSSKMISPIPEDAISESFSSSFCSLDDSNSESKMVKDGSPKIKMEKMGKQKKGKNQTGEKGWSVWYSSRRKQNNSSLGPLALEKLISIYRILWRMDSTRIFKYPSSNSKLTSDSSTSGSPRILIEHYRKVIKNPMFLDTIGYKLKNHVYRKAEHVIKDFRKIVYNSNLYHKNDKDCLEKIEVLSRKLEELVNQYFADERIGRSASLQVKNLSKQTTTSGSPTTVTEDKDPTLPSRRPSRPS